MEIKRQDLELQPAEHAPAASSGSDSFGVIDYVRELYLNSEEQKENEKKKIRLLRAAVTLLALLCAALLLSAVVLVPRLFSAVTLANQTLDELQKVDIESIAGNIDALTVQASDTFETVGESAKVLNALDMETLNKTIEELKTGVESLNQIDVKTLNDAISNLNATVEPIAKFFGKK